MIAYKAQQDTACLMTQHLQKHWAETQEQDRRLAMVLVDIDHFQQLRKNYGEQVAEDCLLSFRSLIGRQLRQDSDFAVPCGHDVFCVILPNVSAQIALVIAERIRMSLGSLYHDSATGKDQADITVSCGVASVEAFDMPASEALIKLADNALHLAKVAGRNRTVSMVS